MGRYLFKRIGQTIITILFISIITYIITMQLPGDPVIAMLGEEGGSQELIDHYREKLGLDKPIFIQYFRWLRTFIGGDLGTSIRTRARVTTLLAQRFPITIQLMLMGLIFALLVAIPLGVVSAIHPNTGVDTLSTIIAVSGVSMPRPLTGIILILIFSLWLKIFPSSGYISPTQDLFLNIKSLIMPAIVLGSILSAELTRHIRSSFLEILQMDYITTARSKGISEFKVIAKHVAKNAAIPVITLLGMRIGRLLGGIVVVEVVFSLPGIGRLLMNAVLFRDYPVLQTGIILVAVSVTVMNLLSDIAYSILDPRVRYD